MKIIGSKIISTFSRRHADARSSIQAWYHEVKEANWKTPLELKERYPHASILPDNRIIFNIKGNKYRIDTKVSYKHLSVRVIRIGTHSGYSKWR